MNARNATGSERRSARERLLDAADALFYEGGIHTIGIDRVIERAGVAKASLYDCFGSKEALVQAYLQARQDARKARIEARLARYGTPRERLLGLFDGLADVAAQPGFRGCAFTRAGAEVRPGSPVKSVCDDARAWMRGVFEALAVEMGARDPATLARQCVLLYDGASVCAQMEGTQGGPSPAAMARQAAGCLLDAALAGIPKDKPAVRLARKALAGS